MSCEQAHTIKHFVKCGDWCPQASLLLREGWASLAASVLLKLAAAQKVGASRQAISP